MPLILNRKNEHNDFIIGKILRYKDGRTVHLSREASLNLDIAGMWARSCIARILRGAQLGRTVTIPYRSMGPDHIPGNAADVLRCVRYGDL
jgi:hypothetical protein